ncbi:MAG: MBL fold metallo-hydrolase [Pseudomonadota bacterium]|nr:MBL fold metallo-hydrolase [Pseudomonadota bacterium]
MFDSKSDRPRGNEAWRPTAGAACAALLACAAAISAPVRGAAFEAPPFAAAWNDATQASEPLMQVQRYDADTYIIRQSLKTNPEGPFLFLFFGTERVLQIDTGAGGLDVRPTVDKVIADWLRTQGRKSIHLVVAHSHAHGDHIAGDHEFAGRPDTTVVGHSPAAVAAFFKIHSWPEEIVAFDVGGRALDIVPSPGHEPAEISVFDRRTRLLLTGDELYPGRLYIPKQQFQTYRRSIDRLTEFTRTRNVAWILGNHIEMTQKPGRDFPFYAPSHPHEHSLELPYSSLLELDSALHEMGEQPQLDVHPDFILYPLP